MCLGKYTTSEAETRERKRVWIVSTINQFFNISADAGMHVFCGGGILHILVSSDRQIRRSR